MSDLSRLRARLVRIERTGKRISAELEELRSLKLTDEHALTRTEERQISRLDAALADSRDDYKRVWNLVRREERRLVEEPNGFLRFT